MPIVRCIVFLLPLIWLTGCGDPLLAKIENQAELVDMQMTDLKKDLESGRIRNAALISTYAQQLTNTKPELAPIANLLAKDASTSGPIFTNLMDRATLARTNPDAFLSSEARLNELVNLYQAASSELYNDALSDPLNVLADMSDGSLPRVNAISREASLKANNAEDFGPGSQLVGNPSYGHWQTGNNGMSFWEWYGMYALISNIGDMFDSRRRVSYGHWSSNRNYSYYHDYGRYRYTSPRQMQKQVATEQRAAKSYRGKGKFQSAYAKNRSGSSRVSSASYSAQRAAKSFNSSYGKSSSSKSSSKSSFSNNSSFRSSSSSSRSGFGGK